MGDGPMRAAVIGWPVAHSLSPRIHTAAAAAAGIDLVYTAQPVEPGHVLAALDTMRTEGIRGYSVTMPHKEAVIEGLDELTPAAAALGAVNHITNTNGHLVGNNTDGDGFILGLQHAGATVVDGRVIGVLGSGGAARAIIEACYRHGAGEVVVVARSTERGNTAAALAHERGRFANSADRSVFESCDIIVNATPLGMAGTAGEGVEAVDVASLSVGTTVVDIVYNPRRTPMLAAAQARGLPAVEGVTMLVGQAAEQFTAWTGHDAPLSAMFEAVATSV